MSSDHECNGECSCGSCGDCAHQNLDEMMEQILAKEALNKIKHKIIVLSGKGGVGKSTVAVNLAIALGLAGNKVGLMDVDIHGPSIPKMLNLEDYKPESDGYKLLPANIGSVKVMSIGFLLSSADDAVIWRGPMKAGVIKQFVDEVEWGDLDYLVVDCPPGTGDEPLSIIQALKNPDGAVVVTTPQDVSVADVRKSIIFCHKLELPVIGVIENMSGFVCPHCGETIQIFGTGGGEDMAKDMDVPFLGRIPLEPMVVEAGDKGTPYVYAYAKTTAAKNFESIVEDISSYIERHKKNLLIALPLQDGQLCMHFGRSESFAIFEVDPANKKIIDKNILTPPPHESGEIIRWWRNKGVDIVIAGGMGQGSSEILSKSGVEVITGAKQDKPENIVLDYLNGSLETSDNTCSH